MIDDTKVANQNPVEGENATQENGNITPNPVETNGVNENVTLDDLLRRMDRLERENEELKSWQMNVFTEGKKFYEWPRKFSYKMWGWVPVLSYKSFKKDPTKELVYKNQFNAWISNHYLRLELANKKTVEVEVNEFNRDYTLSEKMYAEKATDNRGNVLGYEFKTEDWGEFIVATNLLNE